MPWSEATPHLAGHGTRSTPPKREKPRGSLGFRRNPLGALVSGSPASRFTRRSKPPIWWPSEPFGSTGALSTITRSSRVRRPGPEAPRGNGLWCRHRFFRTESNTSPAGANPNRGPNLPSMQPAFPWSHLTRGRLESVGATPKGGAFFPHREPPGPVRKPNQPDSDLGFPDRFPEPPIERPLSATTRIYLIGLASWSVSTGSFSRNGITFRDPATTTPEELRTRETPRKIRPKPSPSRGSHPPGRKISSANLPDRKPRGPQPVPCGFDCSRSGVASISVIGNLPHPFRRRQVRGLVCFRAPRRVFASPESHFCHSVSV